MEQNDSIFLTEGLAKAPKQRDSLGSMHAPNIQRHPRYTTNVPVEVFDPKSSFHRRMSLENISVGGAFVRELVWVPPGTRLQVKIAAGGGIEAVARAVHVVDAAAAARKGHPPGAGLVFESLTPFAQNQLNDFCEAISAAMMWPQDVPAKPAPPPLEPQVVRTVATPIDARTVEIQLESVAALVDLWVRELTKGRLFIHTALRPDLRSRLQVRLRAPHGIFALDTEVVHHMAFDPPAEPAFGVGLQLSELKAMKDGLEEFLRGAQARVTPIEVPRQVPLPKVLEEVRQFFLGLESGPVRKALGLREDATPEEEQRRVLELKTLFSRTPHGASAPQQARLDAALRALSRVERQLAVREHSVPGEIVVREDVIESLYTSSPTPIPAAVPSSTDDFSPTQRDLATADSLLSQAEVFAVTDMRAEARMSVAEALKLRCSENLLVRALGICQRTGDLSAAVSIGQRLVAASPRNAKAWRSLLSIYEGKGHYTLALKAAETLLDLEPKDSQLKSRISKLKSLATKQ